MRKTILVDGQMVDTETGEIQETVAERIERATKNSRLREIESGKVLTEEEHEIANQLQAKANARGMKLVPDRKVKNKAKFAQLIQENILYLREMNYLTTAEKNFLFDIAPNVGFMSNGIVDDIKLKSPTPLTQAQIAEKLGKRRQNVNPIIKSLIDKGVLARTESGLEENNVRAYAIYVNPNVMFCGDRDNVNDTLKLMFKKQPKVMKNLPVRLF